MRRVIVMISIAALVVVASGCGGGGKYFDAKDALNAQADMMEEFAVDIENAKDSDEVVAALIKFQKVMKGAKTEEEMIAVMKGIDQANPPEELQLEMKRLAEVFPRFIKAKTKIKRDYDDDPDVQAALQNIQKAMSPPK